MNHLRKILAAFLFAFITAGPVFASYTQGIPGRPDQQNLRWKGRQIKIAISDSLTHPSVNIKADSDVLGALMRSFKAWEVAADIEFVNHVSEKQSISPSGPVGDGISLITIAQTPENVLLFSQEPDKESAKTRVFYNGKGFITEADIVLNPFQQFSTDGSFGTFDLQATLTHEIGHLLGLRHSSVLGSAMSESFSMNGIFGITDLSARILARNDIAAIRELYQPETEDEACCGIITGRITGPNGRALKRAVRVWAEEIETGRVFAQSETGPDGLYRLGGLPQADYKLFWQSGGEGETSSSGELGSVEVVEGSSMTVNGRIGRLAYGPVVEYIGINSRLANTAVPVRAGRDYMVYLGGQDLDPAKISIEFNSALIRVASASYARSDFGGAASVISFIVSVDENVPAGLYSVFAAGGDGGKTALIGAFKVE